jgi:hypothetical protein
MANIFTKLAYKFDAMKKPPIYFVLLKPAKILVTAFLLFSVAVAFILIVVWAVNTGGNWLFGHIGYIGNITNKGSLGDAINGLSAPVITFLSGVLIFYTFREQNKANRLLQNQWEIDTFFRLYDDLEDRFNELKVPVEDANYMGSGRTTIVQPHEFVTFLTAFFSANKEQTWRHLNSLVFVIDDLTFISDYVRNGPKPHQAFFRQKVLRFYETYFEDLKMLGEQLKEGEKSKAFRKSYGKFILSIKQLYLQELIYNAYLPETRERIKKFHEEITAMQKQKAGKESSNKPDH